MKLEFGCGSKVSSGFDGVDIRPLPCVKYVCDAWDITKHVKKNSVKEVRSRHFLEHLTYYHSNLTIKAWYDILIPKGKLRICVPDMLFHIEQWLNPLRDDKPPDMKLTRLDWAKRGFWGEQREIEDGEIWDVHKSGYDMKLLSRMLKKHGFTRIEKTIDAPKNLTVLCYKGENNV